MTRAQSCALVRHLCVLEARAPQVSKLADLRVLDWHVRQFVESTGPLGRTEPQLLSALAVVKDDFALLATARLSSCLCCVSIAAWRLRAAQLNQDTCAVCDMCVWECALCVS